MRKKCLFTMFIFGLMLGGMAGCGASSDKTGMTQDSAYEGYADDAEDYGFYSEENEVDSDSASMEYKDAEYDMEEVAGEESNDTALTATQTKTEDVAVQVPSNQKIIKTYNYRYETESFDKAYTALKEQIANYGGYIASSEVYGTTDRSLNLTARIPAGSSDAFVDELGSLGTVTGQSQTATDVTLEYSDTESRIKALKTEQERLNALLEKADDLETIITLEDRMTEVRYELENYESRKRVYDDRISYSTVEIFLQEVNYTVEVDETSLTSRILAGLKTTFRDLKDGFSNFIVWFIVDLPYLIIWGLILFTIWKVILRIRKKRKLSKEKKAAKETK